MRNAKKSFDLDSEIHMEDRFHPHMFDCNDLFTKHLISEVHLGDYHQEPSGKHCNGFFNKEEEFSLKPHEHEDEHDGINLFSYEPENHLYDSLLEYVPQMKLENPPLSQCPKSEKTAPSVQTAQSSKNSKGSTKRVSVEEDCKLEPECSAETSPPPKARSSKRKAALKTPVVIAPPESTKAKNESLVFLIRKVNKKTKKSVLLTKHRKLITKCRHTHLEYYAKGM